MPNLIYNAIQTPDGTVIESTHRHHFVTYIDENGKTYMVDGGLSYLRRSANGDEKDLSLYDDQPHYVQRRMLRWGTYGKDGDQPLKRVQVANMEREHIKAVLNECDPMPVMRKCMERELVYRDEEGLD